jgi:hypothetical protein
VTQTNYREEARDDAKETARNFLEEIVAGLTEWGKASDDLLNDYPNGDAYHHETHTDKAYSLSEAVELLEALDEYEETDSGLWEGLPPRDAISAQAAYTYSAAVYSLFTDLIRDINDDMGVFDVLQDAPQEAWNVVRSDGGMSVGSFPSEEEAEEYLRTAFPGQEDSYEVEEADLTEVRKVWVQRLTAAVEGVVDAF